MKSEAGQSERVSMKQHQEKRKHTMHTSLARRIPDIHPSITAAMMKSRYREERQKERVQVQWTRGQKAIRSTVLVRHASRFRFALLAGPCLGLLCSRIVVVPERVRLALLGRRGVFVGTVGILLPRG